MSLRNAFELVSHPLGSLERWIVRHPDGSELEVLAGFGAGLNAWRVPTAQGTLDLLAGYTSEDDLRARHADTSAGVRLSPFPNRLRGGEWKWNGKSGKLPINFKWQPHAIHGLLHTQAWQLISFASDSEAAELVLEKRYTGSDGFPFPFTARTTFRFTGKTFTVKSLTVNEGSDDMPYGEGWHPYFSLGCPVNQLVFRTPALDSVLCDDLSIPTGERTPFADFELGHLIEDRFIDNCWAVTENAPEVRTTLHDPASGRSLHVWQQNGNGLFRYIQAYTPPDRQSIAIEPMTCEPDVLNHHRDLLVLSPGKTVELTWGARFEG